MPSLLRCTVHLLTAFVLCCLASPSVAQRTQDLPNGTFSHPANEGTASDPIRIDKVEPANWWTGMRWSDVQLMVYGAGLDGVSARVTDRPDEAASDAVTVTGVQSVPNDAYTFVDLAIADGAPAGTYTLEVRRGEARATLAYPIRARADTTGRHQGFGPDDVVYLITPDRFANGDPANDRVDDPVVGMLDEYDPSDPGMRHGGDLQGIIDRLDYLADLGVTTLWLTPILENRGVNSYHGYKATDLYRIDPRFGTNDDYRRLVEEAHARGLKIVFDHVSNHIGSEHPWISNLPRASWLNGTTDDHALQKHYKMAVADPHAAPRSDTLLRTFWFVSGMPDLNQRDPLLATYLIQNTLWWIETTGLDGIREDTYPYPNQAFLTRWAKVIREEYPRFAIVGEVWEDAPAFTALFQEGSELPGAVETNLPSVMDFALSEALRGYLRGEERLMDVYKVLAQDFLYPDPPRLMTLADNHDMPRIMFEAEGDTARVKQALTILLTTRGIPQLLYGTELGMKGGASHIELRADMPGGFPGDERNAFTEAGRTKDEQELFAFTRDLLHLRDEHVALRRGTLTHVPPTYNSDVYVYMRTHGTNRVLVVVNGHEDARTADLSELFADPDAARSLRLVDARTAEPVPLSNGTINVGAYGVRVLEVRP